jgi:hypothetical protein
MEHGLGGEEAPVTAAAGLICLACNVKVEVDFPLAPVPGKQAR